MADKDWEFLLACVKHTATKPDFHEVAKELGLKSHTAAYQRHWALMKKLGVAGSTGKGGRKPASPTAAAAGAATNGKVTATPKLSNGKRGRPAKTNTAKSPSTDKEEGEADNSGIEEIESPAKKMKEDKCAKKEPVADGNGDERSESLYGDEQAEI